MIITCLIALIIVLPLLLWGILFTKNLNKLLEKQARIERDLNRLLVEYIMQEYINKK